MTRQGVFAATLVVVLLALGPFAAPSIDDVATSGVGVEADHRNDIPVVQPSRPDSPQLATQLPSSRSVLVVVLVAGLLLATAAVRRRPSVVAASTPSPPSWSRPPRRGPPLLAAG